MTIDILKDLETNEAPVAQAETQTEQTVSAEGQPNKYAAFTSEDLVKKALHADEHIKRLEQEAKDRESRLDAMVSKLDEILSNKQNRDQVQEAAHKQTKAADTDLDAVVEAKLLQREQKMREATNKADSVSKLVEVYGSKAKAHEALTSLIAEKPQLASTIQTLQTESPALLVELLTKFRTPGETYKSAMPSGAEAKPNGVGFSKNFISYSDYQKTATTSPAKYRSLEFLKAVMASKAEAAAKGVPYQNT